jgi:Xaa-Pro aminopeptidase
VFNPVVTAYGVLSASGPCHLFVSPPERVTDGLRQHLGDDVQVHSYEDIEPFLVQLAHECNSSMQRILVDANTINWRLHQALSNVLQSEDLLVDKSSIINMAKSIKNEVELEGFRRCHVRDGVALTAYFAWLESTMREIQQSGSGNYPSEYYVALKLEEFRKQMDKHVSPSFDTISSYGANGTKLLTFYFSWLTLNVDE